MRVVFVECGNCGYLGAARHNLVDDSDRMKIKNSRMDCPACGAIAPIRDGVYGPGSEVTLDPRPPIKLDRSKNISLYIDESASHDGDKFVFGAILIPDDRVLRVEEEITSLRKRIGKEMRRLKYPAVKTSPKLRGAPPELHIQHMWQAIGDFKYERSPALPARHRNWIEEVLKIISKYSLEIRSVGASDIKQFLATAKDKGEVPVSVAFRHKIPSDVSLSKIVALENDPAVRLLMEMLLLLDKEFYARGLTANIVADRGRQNEKFKALNTFSMLQPYGFWQQFSAPDFLDSHGSSLLQLADAVAFFQRKNLEITPANKDYPDFKRMYDAYIRPTYKSYGSSDQGKLYRPIDRLLAISTMLELGFVHVSGQKHTLASRQALVRDLIMEGLEKTGVI